ncbi:YceI family protein [Winogradskyella sp.]|uniref:YceI family protein n=1 Tax=Winogradskyella sp. TaxID=1883156 RepID=UPI0025E008E1|nr:YceI family protein [Winogradskyella sp.]
MKNIILVSILILSLSASAQKYFTKTGLTEFKASVEAFESVEAKNESTTAILNTKTGDIAALLFVKAFHFEIALMEEHFNENYMDSDKFPKATFIGKIESYSMDKLSDMEKEFTLNGTLTVRGKAKLIKAAILVKKVNNKIVLTSEFNVSPQDFDIDIPNIVRKKIAKSINLKLCYELVEKK